MIKHVPTPEEQAIIHQEAQDRAMRLVQSMRSAKPAPCEWLSVEEHVLPDIVNVVYSLSFESGMFTPPLDLCRIAQFLPVTKYRPPNPASITIRLNPTIALFFTGGNIIVIRATSPGMAMYYSHVYRSVIEKIPIIMKEPGDDQKPYVGTLEGKLGFSMGTVDNIVGNGVLPQDGVHLTRLLNVGEEKVDYEPDNFPNAMYHGRLRNGIEFTANIASTGKVVLMGLKTKEDLYEAYKSVCDMLYEFEDPNVPIDPRDRFSYRLKQLADENRVFAPGEGDVPMDDILNFGDEDEDDEDGGGGRGRRRGKRARDDDKILSLLTRHAVRTPQAPVTQENVPLLIRAVEGRQVENVAYILESGGAMAHAVWIRDEQGRTIVDRTREHNDDPQMREIHNMLSEYVSTHEKIE